MAEKRGGWRRWAAGVVSAGLVLLVVGLWRSEVRRPEREVLREFYRTRYFQLERLGTGTQLEVALAGVRDGKAIRELVEEGRRGQAEALGFFVEREVRVWWWNGMISTSCRVPERGWEFWFVFASRELDLRRVRRRELGSGALHIALDYGADGRVTFKRGRDSAVFGCNPQGGLEYVRLPQDDGTTRVVRWDAAARVVSDGAARGGD